MSLAEIIDHPVSARAPLVPPTPPRLGEKLSALGRLAALRTSAISVWGEQAYNEDVIKGRFFGRGSFILNTPAAIRHVLVENFENYTRTPTGIRVLQPMLGEQGLLLEEGRNWKHSRRTLAPAFTPKAVNMLIPHMVSATDETIAELDAARQKNGHGEVDLREALQRMTLEIAGRTMFSFEMGDLGPRLRDFVVEYGEKLARPHFFDLLLPLSWPSPQDFQRRRFRKRWTTFVGDLIAMRRAAGKAEGAPPRDLFDLMLAARDPETGAAFDDAQLGDQVATMILAGHETTATALFWTLYVLSLDPEAQEKVAAEVRAADGSLDFAKLPFTRAVIDEVMRLYPPAYLIARSAAGPDMIDGVQVQAKDVVLIAPWLLHRHKKLWDAPDEFHPERFLPGAPAPDRFAYLPFGVGPRVCIGAHFALVEATLALAKLIGTFRVELVDREPVIPIGVVTTQPDRSPLFRISRR